jgi:hypothetical protein
MVRSGSADRLLAAVALPLVLAASVAPLVSLPLSYLLGVGAIPSAGSIGYALFCTSLSD